MPRGKGFTEEIEKEFQNVIFLLEAMIKDRGVPRNIKRIAQQGIDELKKEEETPGVIASNVMYMVGDLSTDANIPFHSRTVVYRIISILEGIKDWFLKFLIFFLDNVWVTCYNNNIIQESSGKMIFFKKKRFFSWQCPEKNV